MNRKKYEDGIQYIADAYGLGNQREKLIEELSELLVAVTHDDRENIAEEMADVRIMIDQVAYLMDIRPEVEGYVKSKIDRTLHEMDGWWKILQISLWRRWKKMPDHDPEKRWTLGRMSEKNCIFFSVEKTAEYQHLRRMASDIDAEIACLEGLDDWQADELARQAMIRKRAIEKRIRDLTEGQP